MPAEAIDYSFVNKADSTQDTSDEFNLDRIRENLDKIRELGEAMIFGSGKKNSLCDESDTYLVDINGCTQSNGLVDWVSQDFKNNSKLLAILTTEIALGDTEDSNYVFNSERISEYSQESFDEDVANMIASISEGLPLDSPESTISLAKRIEAMGDEKMDSEVKIKKWASKLANDISKGKD